MFVEDKNQFSDLLIYFILVFFFNDEIKKDDAFNKFKLTYFKLFLGIKIKIKYILV